MPVYVAFLRGINVGRNNQVSMADLKWVVEDPAFVRAFDHEAIAPDAVRFAGREIYVWYRHGMAGSKIGDTAWRKAGATATDRNWNTVTRLAAMAAEA